MLPLPPTPEKSSTKPKLGSKYTKPIALTETGAASGLQSLLYGRLLISHSSLTAPNDVYVISGLNELEAQLQQSETALQLKAQVDRLTHFSDEALAGKGLSPGEAFWFKGANDIDVQGWALKPRGWTEGQKKKYPVVLLIHGGMSCFSSGMNYYS